MPQRRNPHLLRELARLPWWVSVMVAILVFTMLRWVAPVLLASNRALAAFVVLIASHAHWIAAIFLLPVPFSLFNDVRGRVLVDSQTGIDSIRALSWREFEQLVAEAFRRQGYRVVERGGEGADGGIDLLLHAQDKKLVVQCKRWKSHTVGVALVRELYGAMAGERAHGAIFVICGRYTPDAIDFARDKSIKLIDGQALVNMLARISRSSAKRVPSAIDPQVERVKAEPQVLCPKCGNAMVRRIAKRGASGEFWGCSTFPKCRGTRNA